MLSRLLRVTGPWCMSRRRRPCSRWGSWRWRPGLCPRWSSDPSPPASSSWWTAWSGTPACGDIREICSCRYLPHTHCVYSFSSIFFSGLAVVSIFQSMETSDSSLIGTWAPQHVGDNTAAGQGAPASSPGDTGPRSRSHSLGFWMASHCPSWKLYSPPFPSRLSS